MKHFDKTFNTIFWFNIALTIVVVAALITLSVAANNWLNESPVPAKIEQKFLRWLDK